MAMHAREISSNQRRHRGGSMLHIERNRRQPLAARYHDEAIDFGHGHSTKRLPAAVKLPAMQTLHSGERV